MSSIHRYPDQRGPPKSFLRSWTNRSKYSGGREEPREQRWKFRSSCRISLKKERVRLKGRRENSLCNTNVTRVTLLGLIREVMV